MFAFASYKSFSKQIIWLAFLPFASNSVFGKAVEVDSAEGLSKAMKTAVPGDEIVLASGIWRDSEVRISGNGSPEQPIVIRAAKPGETIITGASRVRISGSYLRISGLVLRNLTGAKSDWLEFRYDSKNRANHCTVEDCWLTEESTHTPMETENRWIGIYGSQNQLLRCAIDGKKNKGATVVVWLGKDDTGSHRLADNYFGERVKLGKNGGETIRIGDSETSLQSAKCLVEGNYFYRCDGETECISNKSCENTYRRNIFFETQGTLTLRHGNGCLVERNIFRGNKRSQTGGVRIIGENHTVHQNVFTGLEGDGFRTPIVVLNGIPDGPLNGYAPVKKVVINNNIIVDCKYGFLLGYNDDQKATVLPRDVAITNNLIVARKGRAPFAVGDVSSTEQTLEGIKFDKNQVQAGEVGLPIDNGIHMVNDLPINLAAISQKPIAGPSWWNGQKP